MLNTAKLASQAQKCDIKGAHKQPAAFYMWRAQESRDATFLKVKIGAGRSNCGDLMCQTHLDATATETATNAAKSAASAAGHAASHAASSAASAASSAAGYVTDKLAQGWRFLTMTANDHYDDIGRKIQDAVKAAVSEHNDLELVTSGSSLPNHAKNYFAVEWKRMVKEGNKWVDNGVRYLAWPAAWEKNGEMFPGVHYQIADSQWKISREETVPLEQFNPAEISNGGVREVSQAYQFNGQPVNINLCAKTILATRGYGV